MLMPRPRQHASDADKQRAFRQRRNAKFAEQAALVSSMQQAIDLAERRGFISLENVSTEEKATFLLDFLRGLEESQLRITREIS
jgi:hypothetical protein